MYSLYVSPLNGTGGFASAARLCHHGGVVEKNAPLPYVDHFGLSAADLRAVLGVALSSGGDFAEIFMEHRSYDLINMEEDIIKETAEAVSLGLGIRVIRGDRTGFGYTNDLSLEKVKKTALTAAAIARGQAGPAPPPPLRDRTRTGGPSRYVVRRPASEAPLRGKIKLVREAYAAAQGYDPRIVKVKAYYSDSLTHICVANSEGLLVRDTRPMIKLICVAISEKDGKRESGYWGGGGRVGMEYFRDTLTPREIGEEAAREAVAPARGRRRPGRRDAHRPGPGPQRRPHP